MRLNLDFKVEAISRLNTVSPMQLLQSPPRRGGTFVVLVTALAALFPAGAPAAQNTIMSQHTRSVQRIAYRGWPDSLLLSNGLVEAVVVPAIGRVMQLRFAGESDGPFWENSSPAAGDTTHDANVWANFGGDKAWPAPQADWGRITGRGWPPPPAFDGRPMDAAIVGPASVTLLSQVDEKFGVRVRRRIELAPDKPVMSITTTYEKISGPPVEVAVWVITQLKDPLLAGAPLASPAGTGGEFVLQSGGRPAGLNVADGILSLTRDPRQNHKIGMRAATLVWVGATERLRIDSAIVPGAPYTDDGCNAEVYTNADPLRYVELEMLGPLARLADGGKIEHSSTYALERRTGIEAALEIRRILKH